MEVLDKIQDGSASQIMCGGGYGCGKSLILCISCLREALKPGNEVMLCRDTFASLRKTTLLSLLKSDGKRPAILPAGCYNWRKDEQCLDINGGGRIWLVGVRDSMSLRSFNVGGVFIDELTELSEDSYEELVGRIRGQNTDRRFVLAVTNPGSPSHWAHKKFFSNPQNGTWNRTVTSYENPSLPHDYIERLESLTGSRRERCLLGRWVGSEHQVWPEFDRGIHVRHEECVNAERWILGIDFGYSAPSAFVLGAQNGDRVHVAESIERPRMLMAEIVKLASSYADRSPTCVVDPSAAQLIAELRNAGLKTEPAMNKVEENCQVISEMLTDRSLSFEPGQTQLLSEIESYSRDGDGRIVKENDHGVDGMKYMCAYARGQARSPGIWIMRAGEGNE